MAMQQITDHILMVRPANFGYNEQTAANNAFQKKDDSLPDDLIQELATAEFDELVAQLRKVGVEVLVVLDSEEPIKPDAIFPNNWVTFHQNGLIVTYPMNAPVRRLERREEIIRHMNTVYKFDKRLNLEDYEAQHQFLEGTGSLILDRPNQLAYACISPRTDEELLHLYCQKIGYQAVPFTAVDAQGQAIYHTNVMMALGETFVVICLDTIKNPNERALLLEKFEATQKEVIEISLQQMMSFAGNMLQVRGKDGQSWLVMSEQAHSSLSKAQIETIEKHTKILYSYIGHIEKYGGGSVRCMMAEVFVPD
ncbi:MAG TPA: arginine deiminase-related protein [Saprospiraceae bacterium]|nr:arginine deiminase-related protein [Saprospiraceae bacterium]HMQ85259.1 arginine deiminase-related protein [Saprospiraceae bacterium]